MGQKETNEEEKSVKKCAHTGKVVKRVKRYYRNGKYFMNKNAYKAYGEKLKGDAQAAAAPAEEKK